MGLLLDKAIIFAVNAHRGQLRKGSNAPYILHPMEAAAIVAAIVAGRAEDAAEAMVKHILSAQMNCPKEDGSNG